MTFSNHINSSDDEAFLRDFPIPNEFDSDWVLKEKSSKKYCIDCEYYDETTQILPCAVNPLGVHDADNCQDYHEY